MRDDEQPLAPVVSWGRFAAAEPELAEFGATLLSQRPAYLATVREGGAPRVHPVTPILAPETLFVFMEPTSPKRKDLLERGWFALHNGVPDNSGTGGEFSLSGRAFAVDDDATRVIATKAASYEPADRYVLFELRVGQARCNGYGDITLPARRRWSAGPAGQG